MELFSTLKNFCFHLNALTLPIVPKSPYNDIDDQVKHLHNIEQLAEEVHRPVQEVIPLYEDVLADLKSNARIHDYLPILVSKNVKHRLKNHY